VEGDLASSGPGAAERPQGRLRRCDFRVDRQGERLDPSDATVYTVTVTLDASTLGINVFARLLPMLPTVLRSSVSVRKGGL
ncbi:hypothetical protein OMR07_08320, partial [Methylobacterium organophilum]|nr:hypothetical protein [Methylobacterium organophilum]